MTVRFPALLLSAVLLPVVCTGCHITSNKNGKNDNVDIGTPFGSMQVKTNDNVSTSGLGITPYPGAQLQKKDKDGDSDAADVNMSFGSFHLGVKAVNYLSPDGQDKVLAFYKKDLAHFGAVLECDGSSPVGQPTRTEQGLTCDYDQKHSGHVSWNDDGGHKLELRAGSKQHQHIVAVEKKDAGTKISLVALDLPGNLSTSDDKSSD